MGKRKNSTPHQRLCSANHLHRAWQQIYENGLQSDSKDTRGEVRAFKEDERSNIDRIYRQILNKKFTFKGNRGVTLGKKKRPIVLAPVESRVVQRAILDVLQDEPGIQKFLRSSGSYGAIKSFKDQEKGVPAAIKDIVQTIKNGATTYYKSDIASFFTKIPRGKVIDTIAGIISDQDFLGILDHATNLEIDNILSIPEDKREFFDYRTVGTPQGCCLSPLLGNILLYEFDTEMNKNGIRCFRYLDDFIILGNGWKPVNTAFGKALEILKALGLDAYRLNDGSDKATSGNTNGLFQFLGVEFKGKNIRPSKKSRDKLMTTIEGMLKDCVQQDYSVGVYGSKEAKDQREHALVATLHAINNKLLGWGNQYYFCNEDAIWGSVDAEVDALLNTYLGRYSAKKEKGDTKFRRRMLGVHLVSESKRDPIIWDISKKSPDRPMKLGIAS